MNLPLRMLNISDIHGGHDRVSTELIIDRFDEFVTPHLSEIQMMTIDGDTYDRLLTLHSRPANQMTAWGIKLLHLCEQNNIVLRVLRGTYSHDYDQPKVFETWYNSYGFKFDFKYVDTVSCEYIKRFKMKVVYLPDDLPYKTSDECIDAVRDMIRGQGWDKVDYCFGHGTFDYAISGPAHTKPAFCYRVEQFDFVTKKAVFGHVHTHSARGNMFYNGSFDRLRQGEEEPKGFTIITDDGKSANVTFYENKKATLFKTIDMSIGVYADTEAAVEVLLRKLSKAFPKKSSVGFLRILYTDILHKQIFITIAHQNYPNLTISSEKQTDDQKTSTIQWTDLSTVSLTNPTQDNLPEMLSSFVETTLKASLSPERIKQMVT